MRSWGRMASAIPRIRTRGQAPARTPTPIATWVVPPSPHCSQQALGCAQQQRQRFQGTAITMTKDIWKTLFPNLNTNQTDRQSIPRDSDMLWAWGTGVLTSQHPKSRGASQAGQEPAAPQAPCRPRKLTGTLLSAGRATKDGQSPPS